MKKKIKQMHTKCIRLVITTDFTKEKLKIQY